MVIVVSYSQEWVHRISLSSTNKRLIRMEADLQVHVHFSEQRWYQDGVKQRQCLEESHSDRICFPQ